MSRQDWSPSQACLCSPSHPLPEQAGRLGRHLLTHLSLILESCVLSTETGSWNLSDLPSKVSDTGQGLEGTEVRPPPPTCPFVQHHQQQQQNQAIFPGTTYPQPGGPSLQQQVDSCNCHVHLLTKGSKNRGDPTTLGTQKAVVLLRTLLDETPSC